MASDHVLRRVAFAARSGSLLPSAVSAPSKTPSNVSLSRQKLFSTSSVKRAPAEAANSAPKAAHEAPMPWAEYLSIRRAKHRYEWAALVPSSMLGFGGGFAVFGSRDMDPTQLIFGVEPIWAYAAATVAAGALGAVMGPTIGASIWRLKYSKSMPRIEAREREFYQHIIRNRVDPSAGGSANNPVPDFYGERIGNLHQYRQWLRDQNKFRRKARWLEEE